MRTVQVQRKTGARAKLAKKYESLAQVILRASLKQKLISAVTLLHIMVEFRTQCNEVLDAVRAGNARSLRNCPESHHRRAMI